MDSRQLRCIVRADPVMFSRCIGVYPCDKLPVKQPGFVICNEDNHTQPGSHWVCIFLSDNGQAEFFNSYGGPPKPRPIVEYLVGCDVVCSQKQVQSFLSTTCGQHCLYFAFHRCRGIGFQAIVESYAKDQDSNDQMVCDFIEDQFGYDTEPLEEDFLFNQISRCPSRS